MAALGVEFLRFDGLEQDAAGVWSAPSGARVAWFHDPDGNVLSVTPRSAHRPRRKRRRVGRRVEWRVRRDMRGSRHSRSSVGLLAPGDSNPTLERSSGGLTRLAGAATPHSKPAAGAPAPVPSRRYAEGDDRLGDDAAARRARRRPAPRRRRRRGRRRPATARGGRRPSAPRRRSPPANAATRRCRGIAPSDSARTSTVGTSTGLARVSTTPARSPESSSAPSVRLIGRVLEVRVRLAVLEEGADAADRLVAVDVDGQPRRVHHVAAQERPDRLLGEVPGAEARLQRGVASTALDDARVQPHAGGEGERAAVDAAEVHAPRRPVVGHARAGARSRRRRRWGSRASSRTRCSSRRAGWSSGVSSPARPFAASLTVPSPPKATTTS